MTGSRCSQSHLRCSPKSIRGGVHALPMKAGVTRGHELMRSLGSRKSARAARECFRCAIGSASRRRIYAPAVQSDVLRGCWVCGAKSLAAANSLLAVRLKVTGERIPLLYRPTSLSAASRCAHFAVRCHSGPRVNALSRLSLLPRYFGIAARRLSIRS